MINELSLTYLTNKNCEHIFQTNQIKKDASSP